MANKRHAHRTATRRERQLLPKKSATAAAVISKTAPTPITFFHTLFTYGAERVAVYGCGVAAPAQALFHSSPTSCGVSSRLLSSVSAQRSSTDDQSTLTRKMIMSTAVIGPTTANQPPNCRMNSGPS